MAESDPPSSKKIKLEEDVEAEETKLDISEDWRARVKEEETDGQTSGGDKPSNPSTSQASGDFILRIEKESSDAKEGGTTTSGGGGDQPSTSATVVPPAKEIYQFKVDLRHFKPPVWRRILVPDNYTFKEFHVAIQDAMGWHDCHVHTYDMPHPTNGNTVFLGEMNFGCYGREEFSHEKQTKLSALFTMSNKKAHYVYDLGENWDHDITLEKILPVVAGEKYPQCPAGKGVCPMEDGGGGEISEDEDEDEEADFEEKLDRAQERWATKVFQVSDIKFRNLKAV